MQTRLAASLTQSEAIYQADKLCHYGRCTHSGQH